MHVNNIIVQNKDIEFAERILLGEGQTFNEARRNYIKDFNTLDLMAAPGSGKTTLLLAKLLILERNLPLIDNTAILVISHTNVAVDEIRDKLKVFCPKLFNYPNFVGTIQSFVNKYLALPFYEMTYNKKIKSINDKIYYKYVEKYFNSMKDYKLKAWLNKQYEPGEFLKRVRLNENGNLIMGINGLEDEFKLKNKGSSSYEGLKRMKEMLLKSGILHYDDAYYLAMKYINTHPEVVKLLQKRFSYIFVDEMQDMDVHQYRLLERIFSDDNIANTSFQRLGDNNQAIYNNIVKSDAVWENRDNTHTISGSNRLTKLNANLASRFSIDNSFIEGLNIIDKEYKPVLLVYDQTKVECSVIKTFSEYLIDLFKAEEKSNDIIYKVVSWRRHHRDKEKITLSSYCPQKIYMRGDDSNSGISLNKNLDYYKVTQILIDKIIEKLNGVNIKVDNRDITKFSLTNYLKELESDEYDKYKLCIYRCVNFLCNGNHRMVYQELNAFLEILWTLFNDTSNHDNPLFIQEDEFEFIGELDSENKRCHQCDVMGWSPTINSVHSVKGETHDATLFLESFYNSNYESDVLYEVLCGKTIFDLIEKKQDEIKNFKNQIDSIVAKGKSRGIKTREEKIDKLESRIRLKKEYAKLVYVALTRAKSVVGYAISRERYNKYLEGNINMKEWEVVFVE